MIDLTQSPDKLKASILQDAMQGKLTKKLPEDGNASDLLKSIEDEKQRLIDEGKIKKQKHLPDIDLDEAPFTIPDNWRWVRISEISTFPEQQSIKPLDISDDTWVLDLKEIQKNTGKILSKYTNLDKKSKSRKIIFNKYDVLYSKVNPYLNKVVVAPDEGVATSELLVVHLVGFVNANYLAFALRSPFTLKRANKDSYGTKMPRVGTKDFSNYLIPLPPLSEQQRIVDKLDELLSQVDSFSDYVSQIHDLRRQLPIKLRKSFLQSAMQGKLTHQLDEDGNASDLLQSIESEKQRLIDEGKIKKQKPLPCIDPDEIPFKIPDNWQWVRLGNVSSYIQRGKSPKYGSDGIKVLSQKCVQWNGIDLSKARTITKDSLDSYDKIRYLKPKDILWNSTGTGTLGRVAIINTSNINENDLFVADSHVTVIRLLHNISSFVFLYISSPEIQLNLDSISSGSTNQIELSKKSVENLLIPLPPLAEQQRIVSKLDSLFLNLDKM